MSNLIEFPPIVFNEIESEQIQTVNARTLYESLGVRDHFATWIKGRIAKGDFIENQDFIERSGVNRNLSGGGDTRSVDYYLTLNTAKEIAMMDRGPKGKKVRKYFLECERQYLKTLKEKQSIQAAPTTIINVTSAPGSLHDKLLTLSALRDEALQRPTFDPVQVDKDYFKAVKKHVGFSFKEIFQERPVERTRLQAVAEEPFELLMREPIQNPDIPLSPSELGALCGKSSQFMNKLLEKNGLQRRLPRGGWEPTAEGLAWTKELPSIKYGNPGYKTTWLPNVLHELR